MTSAGHVTFGPLRGQRNMSKQDYPQEGDEDDVASVIAR